jgi:hypothetical protein
LIRQSCRNCDEPLPANSDPRRKYCSDRCRVAFSRHMKSIEPLKGKGGPVAVPEHIQKARALAFGNMEDEVREVMREEIRKTVTQAVKDNVLGAAEGLTHLLPTVIAGLIEDVQSEDWMIRGRAQAVVLKYAMPFGEEKVEKDDLRIINVIHNVPIPDSPLGEAIEGQLVELAAGVERFEADWPECSYCHDRKHPDTGTWQSNGENKGEKWVCRACEVRKAMKQGKGHPAGFLEDKLYG